MEKQVELWAKSENTCKKVYEQSPNFHQCERFCQMQCCSIRAPRRPYGQNADSWDLPVKGSPRLRKAPSSGCFHRSRSLSRIRKNRFRFAINCKSTGFSLRAIFSSSFKKIFSIFHFAELVHSTVLTPFLPKSSLFIFPSMTFLPGLSLSPSETLPLTLYESK